MPEPSFPPDSIRAPIVVRKPISMGTALVVGTAEHVVFVKDGAVAGALGPGSHLLDVRALPFLQGFTGSGSEALVVMTAVHGVRIRGATGEVFDSGSGLVLAPRLFGEVGVKVVDPLRAALVAASGGSDADATLRGYVQHGIIEGAKAAVGKAGQEGRLVRVLTDRAAQPELSEAIAVAARPRLADIGVEITAFGSVVVALSEEDMAKAGGVDVTAPPAPVYEMLWDCKFCGTKKLLGLTHRHCPSCGAPQGAEGRYFPSDDEKVPAKDHEYFGADLHCAHCGFANGSKSKHCAGCGAPLEGAKEVARKSDEVVAPAAVDNETEEKEIQRALLRAGIRPSKPPAPRTGPRWGLRLGCLLAVVLLASAAALLLWKKPGGLEVVRHTWKREIAVERYGPSNDSAWCDQLPSEVRDVRRRHEVRSHERVADGQDCHTRKVDRGNGTFTEQQECAPRFRDEPVYADKCYFTVDRWTKARSATAEGASLGDAPRWPDLALARAGRCVGCEREGARTENYVVVFRDDQAREHSCEFDQVRWSSFADGSRWAAQMGVVSGALDCNTLSAQ
jgi:hypothetical protein